ncbi:pyridoxamine 5'-phosphate oxidase family protein [Nonomuraea dietziae]|uniref:pyridoxamine 5'-phosphate oxidase family protein n=1 Tax=Nonomuraea dietziae TaxID=65515 RepID=UPI0034495F1F
MTAGSDLGRRIAYHRERLGLSYDELAERAEMSSGYLHYLEESPGSPTMESLIRLAQALDTTVDDLLGEGTNRPQGQGPAMANPTLEVLEEDECLRLVSPGGIGRVAFGGQRGPTVLPVNYRFVDGAVVFRTAYGGPMDEDLRTGLEGVEIKVGFEVDRIDEARREGWSVLIQGPAHHVEPDEIPQVSVTPWAGGERELYIRIVPSQITGRRIHNL